MCCSIFFPKVKFRLAINSVGTFKEKVSCILYCGWTQGTPHMRRLRHVWRQTQSKRQQKCLIFCWSLSVEICCQLSLIWELWSSIVRWKHSL
jgi:hypothetical protein